MAIRRKTNRDADLEELRELVESDSEAAEPKVHSRRGLLKIAGAALAGAAGAVALRAVPAAAATGDAVLQGTINLADNETTLITLGGAPLSSTGAALIARASNGLRGAGYYSADRNQSIGVLGISKNSTDIINQDIYAPGPGTGVMGLSSVGVGVEGSSSTGSGGLFLSGTGYDAQLGYPTSGGPVGSGRLAMVGRTDVGGVAPNIAPLFVVVSSLGATYFQHELVRGNDGSIWATRFAGSGTNQSRWKRINAVRVDSSDGLGTPFKPKRVVDTRLLGAIKPAGGTPTQVQVAGVGTLTSNIPSDAVAVIGNLTAAGYTGGGWLSIMPAGIVVGTGAGQYNPASDPSSVNFQVGQGAIANSFVCGLGNSGKVQVYVGGHASHFIIDITGYMQ